MRVFKYITDSTLNVEKNVPLQFALRHSMRIFPSNALYTMIPKNGCSSLRYSIAVANGCVAGPENLNWIHQNNQTFKADLESAYRSEYAFIVLRCPYRRLLSAFYDKIVNVDIESWELFALTERKIHPHDMNFSRFIDMIASLPRSKWDPHWRPQSDFLLFEEYDDVFAVENYDWMKKTVKKKAGFEIIDTRPMLRHDRDVDQDNVEDDADAAHYAAIKLLNMKRQGVFYSDKSFFPAGVLEKINRLYDDDIRLYRSSGFGHLSLIQR
ncbi:MAG: sulfotransferase family protein [Sphingomonadales bacterium]|nr:sulfotransferase family protein [Sphingomonadales bacterium]